MNSTTNPIGIIRPEEVARKLAAIRNYEQPELMEQIAATPRLVELLWFVQFMSMQPGGLGRFCEDMFQALPHRFGTDTMRAAKPGEFSQAVRETVWQEIPKHFLPEGAPGQEVDEADDWYAVVIMDQPRRDDRTDKERRAVTEFLKSFTRATAEQCCLRAARRVLPEFLAALCQDPCKGLAFDSGARRRSGCWFIDDPITAVLEMMDRRAAGVSQRLAMTAVSKLAFDALDYALQERAMVRVEGDSRFGKTESVKAWCDMRPGLARLVKVPSSNSLADLHRRIAEALGMDVSFGSRSQRLKERVEYVLQHGGLFLVLDEAAFLVPQNYTAQTAPARLNWVRTEIVDRGLPLAVVVTPQSFLPAVQRFVKKTGYAMEQFFGRNYRTVRLPAELGEEDMIAVARIHFPELEDDYLALIASYAQVSENYLQAVEAIAKLARYIARREKHRRITVADIEAAVSEVIPRRPMVQGAEAAEPSEEPKPKDSRATRPGAKERPLNVHLNAPLRHLQPATARDGARIGLQSCSL